jgi:dienelactone hydrolase
VTVSRLRRRAAWALAAAAVVGPLGAVLGPPVAGAARLAPCPEPVRHPARPRVERIDPDDPVLTRFVVTFVDYDRASAPDGPGDAPVTCRVLETTISMPADATVPRPLILVVHGRDGDPAPLGALLDTWAEAGYAVAAPRFLRTDKDADDMPTAAAVARQTADARFVLSRLVELAAVPGSPLSGRVDVDRIGAAGMSLGGMTTYGLVSNTCCRDPRVDAAVLLAAVHRGFDRGRYITPKLPMLLIQGDADNGYHNSVNTYPTLAAPTWFVTLHGSTHSPPFEEPRGPEAPIVDGTTVAFWNRYLRGDDAAEQSIVDTVAAAGGLASLRHRT